MKENGPQNYARTRLQKQNAHLQAIQELEESASNNDSEEVIIDNLSIAAELAEAITSNIVTNDHQEEEHLPTEASTEPAALTDDFQDEESEQQDRKFNTIQQNV